MRSSPAIETALKCYPDWWRTRYGAEVRQVSNDLTNDGRSVSGVTLSLLRGAVRARTTGKGMPMAHDLWAARTRMSVASATLPWMLMAPLVLYVIGNQTLHSSKGLVFSSGFSFHPSGLFTVTTGRQIPAPPLTHAASLAEDASSAIAVLFLLTLIVLMAGWGSLVGAIRRSSTPHRRRVLVLAWAPFLAILTDFVLILIQNHFRPTSFGNRGHGSVGALNGNPALVHSLGEALAIVAGGGWLVAIACVAIASKRAEIGDLDMRFGRTISTMVAGLLTLFLVAFAIWGIGLFMQSRQAMHGEFTTVSFPNQALWPATVTLLLCAVMLSVLSASAARKSWRVVASLS